MLDMSVLIIIKIKEEHGKLIEKYINEGKYENLPTLEDYIKSLGGF